MKKVQRLLATVLALSLMFLLCACGAKESSNGAYYQSSPSAAAYDSSADYYETSEAEVYYDSGSGLASMDNGSVDAPEAPSEDLNPDKIIYSADARVETTEFEKTIDALNALIAEYGGFVESSSVSSGSLYSISRGDKYNRSANYTIRIPSQHFNTVMNSLSTLGNVPSTSVYSENISAQYYDTQARLEAYRTQEQTLNAMMEKAETIEDVLAIEDKLTDLRYRIESLQSTMKNWDRKVSYSTISLRISEVSEYSPEPEESYLSRLGRAFKTGFESFVEFLGDLLVFLASALPFLVVLAIIIFVLRPVVRKAAQRRKEKKELKRQAKVEARQEEKK